MANRADRNNNPTNIKVPNGGLIVAKQRYSDPNVSVDPVPASDGGQFLKFSTPEIGKQATSTLLKDPLYQNLTVDKAMKTWSGGGYGGEIAPDIAHKTVGQLSPDEMNTLTQGMTQREGGTSVQGTTPTDGQNVGQGKPQLSHDQLIQNIHAMEKQGAKPQEVQSYLDSLKQSGNFSGARVSFPDALKQSQGATQSSQVPTEDKKPGFFQGLLQDVAKYPLEAVSSIRQLTNVGNQKEFDKAQNEGYDYGYLGKQRPLGQVEGGIKSVGDFGNALGDTLKGGLDAATYVVGGKALSAGSKAVEGYLGKRLATKILSNPVVSESLSKLVGGGKVLAEMSPKEIYNGLKEIIKTGAKGLSETDLNDVVRAASKIKTAALREAGQVPGLLESGIKGTAKLGLKGLKTAGKLAGYGELIRGGEDIKNLFK